LGDRSIIVGDTTGGVSVWFQVRDPQHPQAAPYRQIHVLRSHAAPVTAITPSPRDKGFLTADAKGTVLLHHATSEQTLLEMHTSGDSLGVLTFAPKADGALAIDTHGRLFRWHLHNPHPEINLRTLFGKVWYEGYDQPEYTWQSSSGSDDFEAKFSLTPLAYGTLKGTFYALLLAVPMSICAAIYTSQFMHPSLRNIIKPTVEVMAALPSVVLGFFAGLWLAPRIEKLVPAVFLMLVALPLVTLVASFFWRLIPLSVRNRFKPGVELAFLGPLLLLTLYACVSVNGQIEAALFHGNFPQWLYDTTGMHYDPRNSLVVGFAMGFAVIPIIYTISEDALSNVPQHLISGSLALGATRWQTAIRVALPTASPGLFSAVMIGFGRAVGETMIVLMATGNTPVMNFSPFNGFRALSANIAVEIPEAPYGGTLYRVLFLAALLLFALTFLVNTAAELVRQRLRERYSRI
jgi:phosphate transport system permease protein